VLRLRDRQRGVQEVPAREGLRRVACFVARPDLQRFLATSRDSTADVVRFSTGQFHVWLAGSLGLVPRADGILVAPVLATALIQHCGDELVARPVDVVQRVPAMTWPYFELTPSEVLEIPQGVAAARQAGRRVWGYHNALIVNAEVKRALTVPELADLVFEARLGIFEESG
jgi:hypothetical protein